MNQHTCMALFEIECTHLHTKITNKQIKNGYFTWTTTNTDMITISEHIELLVHYTSGKIYVFVYFRRIVARILQTLSAWV